MSTITQSERRPTGTNARETAYQIIRNRIIYLDYKPGTPLSDRILAEQLQMSRTPVREALILLSTSNMVVFKPQSGTFVTPIDMERVEVEQFARFAQEKEVISRVCASRSASLEQNYRENLRFYRFYLTEYTSQPDREKRLLELDNAFHRIPFHATGLDASFTHMMESVQHMERFRSLSLTVTMEDHVYDDHQALAEAVVAGNLPEAMRVLEVHMYRYRNHVAILREKFPEYFSSNPS